MKQTITLSSVNREVIKILDKKGIYLFDQYLSRRARDKRLPGAYNPFEGEKKRAIWLITAKAKDNIIKCAKESKSLINFQEQLERYL